MVWVAAEEVGEYHKGDVVELADGAKLEGDRGVMADENGQVLLIRQIPRNEVNDFINDDLRVLTVKFDTTGQRKRAFPDGVDALIADEPEGGLGLEGEGSAHWLFKSWRDSGLTPITHHERWVRAAKVPEGDRSVHEHDVIGRVLEAMLTGRTTRRLRPHEAPRRSGR